MPSKQEVMFNTGASHNYAELATETRENLYIVRLWKNGDFTYSHNCRIVSALPVSPVSAKLIAAWDTLRELLRCYLNTDDINTRNELFWSIKTKVRAL